MVLINERYAVSVSLAKVYENCIKEHVTETHILRMWLPNISSIIVNDKETIIRFKDEKEEINLGFTGYEWIFNDYIDSFYKEE